MGLHDVSMYLVLDLVASIALLFLVSWPGQYVVRLYSNQVRWALKKVGGWGLIIVFHIVTGAIDVIYDSFRTRDFIGMGSGLLLEDY
jgi:hypothetical protein